MAIESGTFSTVDAVGNREDLVNRIFDISPTDCPVTKAIGKSKADGVYHEWQTDELAAADADNAVVMGDVFTYTKPAATVRVGNHTQILRKDVAVTGTQQAVKKAGRKSELGYQSMRKNKELKRDREASICSNNPSVAAAASTAGKFAGFRAWIETNTSLGGSGADGGWNNSTKIVDAATDGTQRDFTKAMLDAVIKDTYDNGGSPTLLIVNSGNKQKFSNFMADTDVAQLRSNVTGDGKTTIVGGVDVYESDFQPIHVKTSRFGRARDGLLIDPEFASIAVLRSAKPIKPAKVSDAEKWVILEECTLEVHNEKAHGCVADLNV